MIFPRPPPIDFFRVLADFAYAGESVSDVARTLGVAESTLRTLKESRENGRYPQPLFETGRALVAYYEHFFHRSAPTRDGQPQLRIVSSHFA